MQTKQKEKEGDVAQEDVYKVPEDEVNSGYTQVKTDCMQDCEEYMCVVVEQKEVEKRVEEEDDVEERELIPKDVDWVKNNCDHLKDEVVP